jgi:hypothetical protein
MAALCEYVESGKLDPDLRVTLSGGLSRYPGSRHWHFKQGNARGTLELTVWEQGRRVWIGVQSGRGADWTDEKADSLAAAIAGHLYTGPAKTD